MGERQILVPLHKKTSDKKRGVEARGREQEALLFAFCSRKAHLFRGALTRALTSIFATHSRQARARAFLRGPTPAGVGKSPTRSGTSTSSRFVGTGAFLPARLLWHSSSSVPSRCERRRPRETVRNAGGSGASGGDSARQGSSTTAPSTIPVHTRLQGDIRASRSRCGAYPPCGRGV